MEFKTRIVCFSFPWVGASQLLVLLWLSGCHSAPLERLEYSNQIGAAFKTVQIEINNNCDVSGSKRIDFMAYSRSYAIDTRRIEEKDYFVLIADSDGDGVSDVEEVKHRGDLCLDSKLQDSVVDFYRDGIVFFLKIGCQTQASLPLAVQNDTDGDGLNDFEEALLGSNPTRWDTDGDGIADSLELRYRTNVRVANTGSLLGDSVTDLEKIRKGIPVDRTVSEDLLRYAYRYTSDAVSGSAGGGVCYHDVVKNVPVVSGSSSSLLAFYKISASGTDSSLEVRELRIPTTIADGAKLSVQWKDLEVIQQ